MHAHNRNGVAHASANLTIRPAIADEVESLSAVARESKAHWGYPDETIESWHDDLTLTIGELDELVVQVATINGEIAGFYALMPSTGESWSLEHFWVLPQYMHRGVGRALLAHALTTAFDRNAAGVVVDADPNAENFYVRCGARRVGEISAPIAGDPYRVRPQLIFTKDR
ncbi:MAG TPA: GNAT family N-acetyltransferase [Candidatus Limnocylindrales bacterium]|nr:GNAT family N-acetyltransferase [Candidatus Limnocylindrales bacterium]